MTSQVIAFLTQFGHQNIMAHPIVNTKESTAAGASPLTAEYIASQQLVDAQPAPIQRFLEMQARTIAQLLVNNTAPIKFSLPDRVVAAPGTEAIEVPQEARQDLAGGLFSNLAHADARTQLRTRLSELDGADNTAIAAASRLLRRGITNHLIYDMLPAGRSVIYEAAEDDAIPTIPVAQSNEHESAITEATDAIAEEGAADGRGELLVPYVPYARRFYLPQWVAFDADDHLIAKSAEEAQAYVASMQRFLEILHAAVALAPYMVEDPEYQRKRYGMLGQLINQGRALARYQTGQIIETIHRRAIAGELNRGLSLSLPYFDDQLLSLRMRDFQVIPSGRIMFVPGFVVRAAQEEQVKAAQDTRLSISTRKHLLKELDLLVQAFTHPANSMR